MPALPARMLLLACRIAELQASAMQVAVDRTADYMYRIFVSYVQVIWPTIGRADFLFLSSARERTHKGVALINIFVYNRTIIYIRLPWLHVYAQDRGNP
jgi:hypothetical protein